MFGKRKRVDTIGAEELQRLSRDPNTVIAHILADNWLCFILTDLGYDKTAKAFKYLQESYEDMIIKAGIFHGNKNK